MGLLDEVRAEFSPHLVRTDKADNTDKKGEGVSSVSAVSGGLSPGELRREAGWVDWYANKGRPGWIEAFARVVSESRLLSQGIVPDTYTEKALCRSCGEVPIPPGWREEVNNCPWCFVGGYK